MALSGGKAEEEEAVIDREGGEYNIEQIGVAVLILAVDTTTRAGSLAVVRDGVVLHEYVGDATRTHAQRLPADVRRVCEAAGVVIRDVELFAVAAGPGSFTGLRIGIAAVQGLAMAWSRQVVPVSTLEALARTAPGQASRIAVWMDAQRGQVFAQVFEVPQGDEPTRPLVAAISVTPDEAIRVHHSLLGDAHFVGDGALKYRETILAGLGTRPGIADGVPALAGTIGRIASHEPGRAVLPHAVVPLYVRRPDAELARERSAP